MTKCRCAVIPLLPPRDGIAHPTEENTMTNNRPLGHHDLDGTLLRKPVKVYRRGEKRARIFGHIVSVDPARDIIAVDDGGSYRLADYDIILQAKIPLPSGNHPFEFSATADTLESAIGEAIGAASVCWENMSGTGVFDEVRARQIVDALLEFVKTHTPNDEGQFTTLEAEPAEPTDFEIREAALRAASMVIAPEVGADEAAHILRMAARFEPYLRGETIDDAGILIEQLAEASSRHFDAAIRRTGDEYVPPTDVQISLSESGTTIAPSETRFIHDFDRDIQGHQFNRAEADRLHDIIERRTTQKPQI